MKLQNKINQIVVLENQKPRKGMIIENVFMQKGEMFGKIFVDKLQKKVELRCIGDQVWIPREFTVDMLKNVG